MEHVEVLRHMKETIRAIIPSEVAALDAAIASLSAPQPPAEAQLVAHYCEHRHKCKWHADGAWPSFGTGEGREQAWKDAHAERCGGRILPLYAHPPPSAPVGVEAVVADMRRWVRLVEASGPYAAGRTAVLQEWANQLEALAQQPAAAGEEVMVNTPYDVFTLPLQPSGLSSGPRFVVHVPGPEQPEGGAS